MRLKQIHVCHYLGCKVYAINKGYAICFEASLCSVLFKSNATALSKNMIFFVPVEKGLLPHQQNLNLSFGSDFAFFACLEIPANVC